ncbi:MAG: HI1506-related protein [Pseudomonadota bacterium]
MAKRVKLIDGRPDGYWRCGAQHTRAGAVFEDDRFTKKEWEMLEADKALSVKAISAEEAAEPDPELALVERVAKAIAGLGEDDFGKSDGKPNLGPLREALPEDAKAITAELRDRVWAGLEEARAKREGEAQASKPAD